MPKAENACVADHPACLLLPGSLCDARLFAPLRAAWAHLNHRPLTRVADLHRLSLGTEDWWAEQVEDLPGPLDVLGFSLGGVLALQLLARAPDRVRRLVLVASNPQSGSPQHRERIQAQKAQWHSQGAAAVAQAMLVQASPGADAVVKAQVLAMAADTPRAAFDAQGELNASRPDGTPTLSRWRGPLLLVSGQNDPWCGSDKQTLIRQARPDAQWLALPETGHYVPLERPLALAQASADFFETPDAG
jgi:pimeloyl-ACP methyl ester carboxylesterase